MMNIGKWGNSLAVRIPAAYAARLGLEEGAEAKLSVEDGRLIVEPVATKPHYRLEDLLAVITPENSHGETETGSAVGNERF